MKDLLRLGRKTLERPNDSGTPTGVGALEWRGKSYAYYVPWLRDHVHTMKGFKYFDGSGAGAVDFFRETQREDGMIWDFFCRRPGAQLLRDGLRPARLRAPLRRRRDGPHAGRGGRRVPLRRGRLLRLEDERGRGVDEAAARRRHPRDGLQLHRSHAILDEVRPRQARLHHRHLGLPDRRRHDPHLPPVGDAPRRPRPLEVRRDVRRQHRLRGVVRVPRRHAGARGAPAGRGAVPRSARRTCGSASTGSPGSARTSATGSRGRDGRARRRCRASGRRSRCPTRTRSTAGSRRSRPPRSSARTRRSAARCRRARPASGTRSTRPSRRASATTPKSGST